MSVYFLSDLHLSHKNVIGFRKGFKTTKDHDEYVLNIISRTLTKRDKLYLLGDSCFTKDSFDRLMSVIPTGCIVVYVAGNHDFERDLKSDYVATHPKIHSLEALVKYKNFYISHAPLHPLELRGKINMHGHTHDKLMGKGYLNVCVEHCGGKLFIHDKLMENYHKQNKRNFKSWMKRKISLLMSG